MSISIKNAQKLYGGATEEETIRKLAESDGYRRIYKYADNFGDKVTHTDYKRIAYRGAYPRASTLSLVHMFTMWSWSMMKERS